MLTPRNVIWAALVVCVLSITWGVLSLLREPDSGGGAADSFGTRAHGQRGLFETMQTIGLPVARSLEPPRRSLPADATVVLWSPDANLVATEPRFLQELGYWVQGGGRLIVTPPRFAASPRTWLEHPESSTLDAATTLWQALQLGDRSPTTHWTSIGTPKTDDDSEPATAATAMRPGAVVATETVEVAAHGPLTGPLSGVQHLELPQGVWQTLHLDEGQPDGELTLRERDGDSQTVLQRFAVGRGEVIVVGDARLFSNQFLARADNSVLAVRLLMGDRAQVQFNEFYHGLSVRGNPLWLLTRRGYALLLIAVLGVIAVATWRSAVLLGPPLTTPEPSRRTVAEYIDAMSRFLNRGRHTRTQLLQTACAGTLRRVATEFDVARGRDDPASVARIVARRDPARAERLLVAAAAVDAVLAKHDKATESETVQALRQLQNCL